MAITAEDFAEWLEPYALETVDEKLTKREILGSTELTYQYTGDSDQLRAALSTEIMLLRREADAKSALRSLGIGARIGARGTERVRFDSSLEWPDQGTSYLIRGDADQNLGNAFLGRRGRVVVIAGAFWSDPHEFERRIEPHLWKLSSHHPDSEG